MCVCVCGLCLQLGLQWSNACPAFSYCAFTVPRQWWHRRQYLASERQGWLRIKSCGCPCLNLLVRQVGNVGNESRDSLKGNHKGWCIRVIPFLIPCLSHQQVKLPTSPRSNLKPRAGRSARCGDRRARCAKHARRLQAQVLMRSWALAARSTKTVLSCQPHLRHIDLRLCPPILAHCQVVGSLPVQDSDSA